MPQANKEKRGELLQEMLRNMQAKGVPRELAIERLEEYLKDPIKLRIINAMAGE
jgi:hypothetical protein